MNDLLKLLCVFAALVAFGCSDKPVERWPASPAEQYGVLDGTPWRCSSGGVGIGPIKLWKARLGEDGYYWCYPKDAQQ